MNDWRAFVLSSSWAENTLLACNFMILTCNHHVRSHRPDVSDCPFDNNLGTVILAEPGVSMHLVNNDIAGNFGNAIAIASYYSGDDFGSPSCGSRLPDPQMTFLRLERSPDMGTSFEAPFAPTNSSF